jgi:DNA end-binding protein Ku
MVSIPVRLFKAARRERIRFHRVYRPAATEPETTYEPPVAIDELEFVTRSSAQGAAIAREVEPEAHVEEPPVARVRNVQTGEGNDKPVESHQVLKGFEVEKDLYVTFEPHEVAALRPKTSTELAIAEFVRLEEIDPIYFETSYYAAPDRGGEKAYALLFRAMAETEYAAIGSLAMHGREHATVIRPGKHGLIVHTLFYEKEVRAEEEYRTDAAAGAPKELELAKTLVRALAVPFEPGKLKDTFEEKLRELIEARTAGATAYAGKEEPTRAPAPDILEALRKSLEMARKPPAQEKAPAAPRKRRSRA